MQRYPTTKKYADSDETNYPTYDAKDINHFYAPCGNTQRGRVHFDAEVDQVSYIQWEVITESDDGMCIIKLADGPDD